MDSARQVIRWSMPGWLFLFWLTDFQIIQNVCVFGSVGVALEHSALSQLSAGAAAVLIGSGVPLGFLIYQLYYHAYDHWMPLSLAPQDRGGDILRSLPGVPDKLKTYEPKLDIEEMCEESNIRLLSVIFGPKLRRLKPDFRNGAGKERFRENRLINFEVIRFYFAAICADLKDDSFRQEYTCLSDIYNAIGASRTALICAFVLYLFYNFLSPIHRSDLFAAHGLPLLINGSVFLLALKVVQSRRTRTGIACQAILSHTTNWYAQGKKDIVEAKDSPPPPRRRASAPARSAS